MRDIEYEATTPVGVHIVPDGDFSLVLHDGGHRVQMWCNDGVVDEWPVTRLRESTGLDDKNGKRIFEGDMIELFNNKNGALTVEYKNAYVGGWVLTSILSLDWVSLGERRPSEVQVIGNIYDNPELTEG